MPDSMIERVARAVMAAPTRNGKFVDFIHDDEAASLVRAVLAAMREPTEAMEQAVRTMSTDSYSHGQMFAAMIDAALGDGR